MNAFALLPAPAKLAAEAVMRLLFLTGLFVMLAPLLALAGEPLIDEPLGPVSPKAEMTAQAVTSLLHKASANERIDLSGRRLAYLDLSDLNFKSAVLQRADLYGTDFTHSDLSGVDLTRARLDRAVLIRANLSGSNLTGATIYRPTVYADEHANLADAPKFAGATMTNVSIQADLSGADFRGADLTNAKLRPLEFRPGEGTLATPYRNILKSCDFSGARLRKADLTRAVLWFSRFTGADLSGANLAEADLSNANLAGADVTGADFTKADLDGADFSGTIGLETVKGWDSAINTGKIKR